MSATILDSLSLNQSGHFVRLAIGIVIALAVTAGLFWMMQYLIDTADRELNESASGHLLDFVRLKRDENIQRRQLKPKKPPPPETPPPQPPTPQLESLNPNAEKIAISAVPVETDIEMSGGFSLGVRRIQPGCRRRRLPAHRESCTHLSPACSVTRYRRILRCPVHRNAPGNHS